MSKFLGAVDNFHSAKTSTYLNFGSIILLPKVKKQKRKEEEIKKPLILPECDINPEEVWYPPDWFILQVHDIMIERYGGYSGLEQGLEPYNHIVEEAKKTEGI